MYTARMPARIVTAFFAATVVLACAGFAAEEPPLNKLPLPTDDQLQAMAKTVGDLYKAQVDAAKLPEQKAGLAQKVFTDAEGTKDDAVARFVLYRAARKLASAGGNIDLAMRATESMSAEFNIDAVAAKVEFVNEAVPFAKTPETAYIVGRYARRAVNEAAAANRYDHALTLANHAVEAARVMHDADIVRQYQEERGRIVKAAAAWEKVKPDLAVLEKSPADAVANRNLGKYYCFVQGNMVRGLPMLALGDDAALKALAVKDLAQPTDQSARLALADAWYDAARQIDAAMFAKIMGRAGFWYRQVLPSLSGINRSRVAGRLQEIDAAASLFRVGEWVELLDLIDISRDRVRGDWQWKNSGLWLPGPHPDNSVIALPVVPQGGYELRIRLTRDGKADLANLHLPFGARTCWFIVNGWADQGGPFTAIDCVDQLGGWNDRNPSRKGAVPAKPGEPITLSVLVETNGEKLALAAAVDGKLSYKWSGSVNSLSAWSGWPVRAKDQLAFGAAARPIYLHSIRFKLNSGSARSPD